MKNSQVKTERRRFLVRRAMLDADRLCADDRIELLLGAADVLPRAEAEVARQAAFTLQASEAQQLKFAQLIGLPPPEPALTRLLRLFRK